MLDAALLALSQVFTGAHLGFLVIGVLVGLVVGILPGLGGIAGMSILLPFLYGMDPTSALGMLIGMVAVIPTGDTFTSVMMGIPGSSASQATVLDGFPLAKKGEAARALSAAFASSLFGGVIGALVLSVAIVLARPLVLSFSSAELFMLTLFGLSMVAVLSGRSLAKGIAAAGLGLIIGVIGTAPATGELRMTLGIDYLYDGIPLVVVAMGLFAIPEIIDLLKRGTAISETTGLGGGWGKGLRDVLRHPWLVARCAGLGCVIGALPGLGGAVVDWIAYSHVVQTSRDKSQFGKGDIRGVIAPESANNACQGGALIPTLLFGVPGSGSMAVFLGGMVLLGIQPGITLVETRLDLTYTIIWSLALANIVGAGLCVLLARYVARLTQIPFVYLAPFMIMITMFAAYQATRSIADLVALLVMGAVGLYMRRFGWPRPALLIGFVLAPGAEGYLYQAVQFYDWDWIWRPGVLIIAGITVASVVLGLRYGTEISSEGDTDPAANATRPRQFAFAALFLAASGACIVTALGLSFLGQVFPLTIGLLAGGGALWVLTHLYGARASAIHDDDAALALQGRWSGRELYLGVFIAVVAAIWLIGFLAAMAIFFPVFLIVAGKAPLLRAAILTSAAVAFIYGITTAMSLRLPEGLLMSVLS
ncbi:tripartite tricarboxylate transporter permease [Pararhodobacter zhoushanensis]|uniref:Tripartite tricarboxylate transporter permease n=1 Tax=Pararhodobacter zhoushanensis TaxID=2479545 RepID=A0ABT3H574_9RHOB|nr:tripartite tricarboxylate transporter permease [Pararhodobacter zhoushanensis]MCW1934939.1 tripartite tricarboxylate transporter permease [Pararhodobacter zhoushanensis]